jgi:hypothetical protein
MSDWNDKAKRLLKSELIKRGVSNSELALRLNGLGTQETKSSIDSKISRGTFSAAFFIQCLSAIGCEKVEIESYETELSLAAEPQPKYTISK